MEKGITEWLIQCFKGCCETYFVQDFQRNIFLYIDLIPHHYLGTEYRITVNNPKYNWQEQADLKFETYEVEDHNYGKKLCKFIQECLVTYTITVNNIHVPTKQEKKVKFYGEAFEPYKILHPTIIEEELVALDSFRKTKFELKKRFGISSINDNYFSDNRIGFSFYTDVVRKKRGIEPTNEKITHGYVFYEIADCHDEIQECLLSALFHERYLSDLMGRKTISDGKTYYIPNLSYNDMQYLIWISFGLDRLYSFWDRITYILANYELGGFKNFNQLSFDKYCLNLKKKVQQNKPIVFDPGSKNLEWLFDFHDKYFPQIIKYRHRVVHYQITSKWEGVLSATFRNNAMENIGNEAELKKLKLEFEGLGNLLLIHFKLCLEGFIKALNLIDEIK